MAAKKKKKGIEVCAATSYLTLEDMHIHPKNPRSISRERLDDLKASIKAKGIYKPFLVWSKGEIVLSGNQRHTAVSELIEEGHVFVNQRGEENVFPVVLEDVTDDMAEAILFDDNNQYGNWVEEKLQVALAEAKEAGKNLTQFGFSSQQVDDILKDALKGAEDQMAKTSRVGEHERTASDKDSEDSGTAPTEKQEALILPKTIYLQLVDIFEDIAVQMNPGWSPGMSIEDAVKEFCAFTYDEGVPDVVEWRKAKAKKDKKK